MSRFNKVVRHIRDAIHSLVHIRIPLAAVALVLAALTVLGFGWGVKPAALPLTKHSVLTSLRTSRVSSAASNKPTLPQCGATRDPFDPTDSSGVALSC